MQAYSMDLRERALLDSDAGMKAADVAVKYRVSGSWVRLLKQRRRETGEVARTKPCRPCRADSRACTPRQGVRRSHRSHCCALCEQVFGWMKTVGGLRKLRHRGIALVDWQLTFAATAYNLVRLRNLEARCP